MIVDQITTSTSNDHTKVSVSITWSDSEKTDVLWYSSPSRYIQAENLNHDAFLVSLLPIAMQVGEPIHICGSVSAELVYNLREYQRLMQFWYSNFSYVPITYEKIAEAKTSNVDGVMCSFSGGVDSTFTLMQHVPQFSSFPTRKITHALYIENFDVNPSGADSGQQRTEFYRFLQKLGITLVPLMTNIRVLYSDARVPITPTYSAIVAGAALLFHSEIKQFHFSADFTYDAPVSFGVNQLAVPLFSTEYCSITYFGGSYSRFEKIKMLAQWSDIYDKILVCHSAYYTSKNCGSCDKCLLTMTALELEGVRDVFSTFPKDIDRHLLRKYTFDKNHINLPWQWLRQSIKRRRWDMVFDFTISLCRSTSPIGLRSPLQYAYRLSHMLRNRYPRYAICIDLIKNKRRI